MERSSRAPCRTERGVEVIRARDVCEKIGRLGVDLGIDERAVQHAQVLGGLIKHAQLVDRMKGEQLDVTKH